MSSISFGGCLLGVDHSTKKQVGLLYIRLVLIYYYFWTIELLFIQSLRNVCKGGMFLLSCRNPYLGLSHINVNCKLETVTLTSVPFYLHQYSHT